MLARHPHLFYFRSLLDGPAPGDDPQARLLVQVQGVIAEYERAKPAERYRRGKLHRARAGEVFFWKVPYGYRRVGAEPDRSVRMEIFEPEADIVRAIFAAHADESPIRQIAHELHDRDIPSPTGKRHAHERPPRSGLGQGHGFA